MMVLSGERGALRLLADVDEQTLAFEALRKCGFAIYNRQRVWRLMSWQQDRTNRQEPPHPMGGGLQLIEMAFQ